MFSLQTNQGFWPACRQALFVLGLFGLFTLSWASHSVTLFNGLASPLFFALSAYLVVLASQYKVAVTPQSLVLFLLFASWAVFTDARSGEFLPALAMDTHWFILPLAVLLIAQVFREYPVAFQALRVGAALCIINLLLTMYLEAEWYFHWHYPPIFGHIRHLGLSIGFLTIFLFTKEEAGGWPAVFFRCCRILGLALVFWSGTRASILAWVFCMAIFIYADRIWAKILLIDTAAGLLLSLIPDPALPHGGALGALKLAFRATSIDMLSSSRIAIWLSTLSGLIDIEKLWTGVGGNGYARLQVMHGVTIVAPGHIQAHNGIIQSICDWGLIGLTLLSIFFYRSTLTSIISNRKNNNPTALAGVIYILVTGMFDATLYHLEHLNYLAISLAYLISQKQVLNKKNIEISAPIVITTIIGFALVHTQTFNYRIGLFWYFRTQ